jgi:hypothetical protein
MASAKGARNAAIWGTNQIQQGEQRTLGELAQGYEAAKGSLNQAQDFYKPYAQRYEGGSQMYSDALGLGGADGNAKAMGAFQAGPGYDFQMQQGLEGLMRKRAAGGMLNSGNADADTLRFSQGLADQSWNSWLDRLMGQDQRGLATAGAQAGVAGQQAGLATNYYGNRAGIINDNVNSIAGLGIGAFKAGDAAKAANQQALMGGLSLGANMLGSAFGMPGMGGMGGSGSGGMPGNMGFLKLFGG